MARGGASGDLLGNYIHYRYSNYLKYGLIVKGSGSAAVSSADLTKTLSEQREKLYNLLNTQYNKAYYSELENQLNYVLRSDSKKAKVNIEEVQKKVLQSKMESLGKVQLSEGDIDWETLSLTSSGRKKLLNAKIDLGALRAYFESNLNLSGDQLNSFMLSMKTLTSNSLGRGETRFNMNSVKKHIDHIKAILKLLNQESATTVKQLSKRLAEVETALLSLSGSSDLEGFRKKRFSGGKDGRNISEELNAIARTVLAGATVSMVEGELAEALVAATANAFQSVGQFGINDIEAHLFGGIPSKNIYKQSSFGSKIDTKELFKNEKIFKRVEDPNNGLYWTLESFGGTKGKVDVSVNFSTNGDSIESGTSVKNYNLNNPKMQSRGLGLVSGTNMITLFQQHGRFLNHYLNQTVDNGNADNPSAGTIMRANTLMKEMIALLAFTGGTQKLNPSISGKMAGVFIINNKAQKGGFKIISMVDLYQALLKEQNAFKVSLSDSQTWDNIWVDRDNGGKSQRITNIMAQVMRHKINVSVDMSAMKKVLYT